MIKKIIICFFLLFFPMTVHAYVDYDIEEYLIDAKILENGNLEVDELLVLDGTFHGYVRSINYRNSKLVRNDSVNFSHDAIYNGLSIENVTVKAKKITNEVSFESFDEEFDTLKRVFYEEDAINKDYVESSMQDGKKYKMFYQAEQEKVGFFIHYTINSAVVVHEDIAELYWTFIGDEFEDKIGNVKIRVTLPQEDVKENFRIWAHGDLTGEIDYINNKTLLATIKKLEPNTPIDIRTTFNKDFITSVNPKKKSNEVAMNRIIEIEERLASEANEQRALAKKIHTILSFVCFLYIGCLIIWWIYVYFRYDKEYKSTFTNKYNREFIDDYNVEVVDFLMNHTITPNAMSASILNLIYKKNIKVLEKKSLKNTKKKNYEFELINRDNVTNTEEVLIEFLFETVGKDNKFTTDELKKYASGTKTYQKFNNSYTNWVHCVRKDSEKENFYEKNGLPVVTSIFLLLIALFILFAALYYNAMMVLPWLVLAFSILFFLYCSLIKKKTQKGVEDYVRWLAFKRFLEDFGTFDEKELPEIHLWERYLVYATVFGIADKVEKVMNVKIREIADYAGSYQGTYISFVDMGIANSINRSIHESITMNHSAYSSGVASSRSSSGSGFGGGFSSGGGFGGGGGGGHGF